MLISTTAKLSITSHLKQPFESFFLEDNDKNVLVKYNLLDKEATKFIILPSEFNYWEKPYWTKEGYLVMVGRANCSPNKHAGDGTRLLILAIDDKNVVYASRLMGGFTIFAGFAK